MPFTDDQNKELKSKLKHAHVLKRQTRGESVSYINGWHAISEANRIFGFDSWDRHTQAPNCIWSELYQGQIACLYSTKVRVTVRAGETVTVREGTGVGFGRSAQVDQAHEIAIKAAETDATKRALATFGNPFGLALYDRDHGQVTRPQRSRRSRRQSELQFTLHLAGFQPETFNDEEAFVAAAKAAIATLKSTQDVYAFWTENLASLTDLRIKAASTGDTTTDTIIEVLRARAYEILEARKAKSESPPAAPSEPKTGADPQGDLAFPKEKRLRDKAHLAFVAKQPCIICGRTPSHAHHLRFAQKRAMGRKVSDKFSVPLCSVHHDSLHRVGDERQWWARHGIIDPLQIAEKLWRASRAHTAADGHDQPPSTASSNTERVEEAPPTKAPVTSTQSN